jgi:hypothetical protein
MSQENATKSADWVNIAVPSFDVAIALVFSTSLGKWQVADSPILLGSSEEKLKDIQRISRLGT